MEKQEIESMKELEDIRHNNRMAEIEAEKKAKIEVENFKFEAEKSLHRLKRADIRRTIESKYGRY